MKNGEQRAYLVWRYVTQFALNAFVITNSFLLMFHFTNVNFSQVRFGAVLVFGNVLLLSAVCCLIEWFLKKMTTDRVVRSIREATGKMAAGDLNARIDTEHLPVAGHELNAIAHDFNLMAEELSSTETLRTDFISNVSHELKTPLAVVKNYASLLESPGLTEEQRREYTEGIRRAVDRTTALMTNILRLNKLENQQIVLKNETYDLDSQIAECLVAFEELWEEKEIEMDIDLEENLSVRADPELMTIVWNNLISNALKFTERGGRVAVRARRDGPWIAVSVADNGCGIDEKTGRHIFDKFYQGDTSHATEGNGLGLAMVKRIVEMTNGEIRVKSRLGEGSTFTVRIRSDEGTKR